MIKKEVWKELYKGKHIDRSQSKKSKERNITLYSEWNRGINTEVEEIFKKIRRYCKKHENKFENLEKRRKFCQI